MKNKVERIKELVAMLNEARKAYEQEDRELMINAEYDRLYDELLVLEEETGTVMANSPTRNVGYEVLSELPKESHTQPMLSLDKTKEIEGLRDFLKDQEAVLSWKLDGLTIVLTYRGGRLEKAVTRGNGEIGEIVTSNARVFDNIPLSIPYKGELVLRGEAVISYSEFERINKEIEDAEAKYKNPRNLCSGSVRQLNNEVTASRKVQFIAFSLVRAEEMEFDNSRRAQMDWLSSQGFDVVEYEMVTAENVEEVVLRFEQRIVENDLPSDGLVLVYDDIDYSRSLGSTSKFPRDSMAFKWADETKETHLLEVEWSPSRTGLINPVAIFEPVELEGTTVSRASVHNLSILKNLKLGIGDEIRVYKANMIIPQILENLTGSGTVEIPETCPACEGETSIRQVKDVETLHCMNPDCTAKKIKSFTLLVSRNALNIEGLSESTLEKFIARGFIKEFADVFHITDHEEEIVTMDGFGEKSYQNLLESLEKARDTNLPKVIFGLGIANVGLANAKMICADFEYDIEKLYEADVDALSAVDGVGEVIARSIVEYFADEKKKEECSRLLAELRLEKIEIDKAARDLEGTTFVITGSVNHFKNRNEIKELIENRGGKVTGSVTKKTSYLINNDTTSNSSKNKKAKELGIPILSEEDFINLTVE